MAIELSDYQKDAIARLKTGSILCGGVGSGDGVGCACTAFGECPGIAGRVCLGRQADGRMAGAVADVEAGEVSACSCGRAEACGQPGEEESQCVKDGGLSRAVHAKEDICARIEGQVSGKADLSGTAEIFQGQLGDAHGWMSSLAGNGCFGMGGVSAGQRAADAPVCLCLTSA